MKRPSRFDRPLLGMVLAAFLCLAGWGAAHHQNKHDMEEFAKIAAHMKTVCVGRFLVDVPRDAQVSLSREMMDTEPMPPHKTEHIVMHIGLAGHPDVSMTLASLPGGGDDPGLLARASGTDAEASCDELLRVTKLRTGPRTIHDMAGEEVLERVREANSATT